MLAEAARCKRCRLPGWVVKNTLGRLQDKAVSWPPRHFRNYLAKRNCIFWNGRLQFCKYFTFNNQASPTRLTDTFAELQVFVSFVAVSPFQCNLFDL